METYLTYSEQETFALGEKIGKGLKPGAVVALFADLGSGKTVLTKGIAAALGLKGVHSPTFTLVNEYHGPVNLYHFDAYRITEEDWLNCGFDEYLFAGGICVIEWAQNVASILPPETVRISLTRVPENGETCRWITLDGIQI